MATAQRKPGFDMPGARLNPAGRTRVRNEARPSTPGFDADVVLVLRSDLRYLSLIRRVTDDVTSGVNLRGEAAEEVKLAVGEACANAIRHGSPRGRADRIMVVFAHDDSGLTVEVADTGPGICPKPDGRRCRLRMGGYGIRLMRALMDDVQFVEMERGTRVIMTKRIRN